jgi:hypothetical protein
VDLTHARFGDAEDPTDLLHVEILVVVQRHDEALLLRQRPDRVLHDLLHLVEL